MPVGDLASVVDRLEAIGQVIEMLRQGACATDDHRRRLCRDVFLMGATDPLVGLGLGIEGQQLVDLVQWHQWLIADAVTAAELAGDTVTADALMALGQADAARALADGPAALAALAISRADPMIVDPLAALEQRCLSLPR